MSVRSRRGRALSVALLLLVGSGCDETAAPHDGGMDGGPSGGDAALLDGGRIEIPDSVSLERYCELAPTFWCAWLDRCRRGCDEYFTGVHADARGWCDAMTERVAEGSAGYDPDRASECLRLAQSELDAACEAGEESRGPLHDCVPFEGRRAPGERCVLPFPLDDTCDPALGTCSALAFTERCPGTCLAHLDEGASCDPTGAGAARCAPGSYCLTDTCVAQPREGEPCGDVPCGDGTRCLLEGDALTCRALRGPGDPCADPRECEDGLGCSPELMECVETVARGAACRSSEECAGEDHCGLDGTCAARRGEGEACADAECVAGLACAFSVTAAEERCQPVAAEEEPCDPGVCADGLWCRHGDGVNECAVVGGVGSDCSGEADWTASARCERGAFCNESGTCEAQRGADEPCDAAGLGTPECDLDAGILCDPFTDSCLGPGETEGARCLGVCTGDLFCNVDTCEPRLAVGDACPAPESCAVGSLCVDLDGTGPRCWQQTSCAD